MKATATALKERSLDLFKKTLKDYHDREPSFLCSESRLTSRIAARSLDPNPPFISLRYAFGTELDSCYRAVLVCRAVVGRFGGWANITGGRGEVSSCSPRCIGTQLTAD